MNISASDDQLANEAKRGNAAAFEELVRRHCGLVHAIGYAHLGQREAAEDLVQEVFLRAHLSLDKYEAKASFAAWLSRIARNLATDWLRRGNTSPRLVPLLSQQEAKMNRIPENRLRDPRARAESAETDKAVAEALQTLPPMQREIVLLHHCEEMSQRQIADQLGVNQATISRHLNRALHALRGQLQDGEMKSMRSLKVSQQTVASAVMIAATASKLTASAKASLLASAQMSGSAGGNTGIGYGMTALTSIITGVKVMSSAKLIVAGVTSLALLGGGTYVYQTSQNKHTQTEVRHVDTGALNRFKEAVTLQPGENIRIVSEIPHDARMAFYTDQVLSRQSHQQENPDIPSSLRVTWEETPAGTEAKIASWDFGVPRKLGDVLTTFLNIPADQIQGQPALLATRLPGDSVIRAGASEVEILSGLEQALREHGIRATFRFRAIQRDVVLVQGDYQQGPVNGPDWLNVIVEGRPTPDSGNGTGSYSDFAMFLGQLGDLAGVRLVDETRTRPGNLAMKWDGDLSVDPTKTFTQVSQQLGYRFVPAKREVRQLVVERRL
jgi:RNA polymerase sigma-70 factor (ECF subfamily)